MVEKEDRSRVGEAPRGDPTREWEVFVREDDEEPLRHVGSVSAPDAEVAREQSSRLFGWYADDLWLCPADEVRRFSTHDLDRAADAPERSEPTNGQEFVDEDATSEYDAEETEEPRVTEL